MIVTEQTIANWRANYGLATRTPPDAVRLWEATGAPAGAVAALGWALLEIERLRARIAATDGLVQHIYHGYCPDEIQPTARDPHCPACLAMGPEGKH